MKASKVLSVTLARFIDTVAIVLVGWLCLVGISTENMIPVYLWSLFGALLLATFIFPMFGIYGSWRGMRFLRLIRQVLFAWTTVILLMIGLFFLLDVGELVSRYWLLLWWFFSLLSMMSARLFVYAILGYMRASGANHKRVVLLGDEQACKRVKEQALQRKYAGYEVTTSLSLSQLEELPAYLSENDELWLSLPFSQAPQIEPILHQLNQSTVNVRWLPDDSRLLSVWQAPKDLLGMAALDLRVSPMSEPANVLLKAFEDKLLSLVILTLISPILLILAIGVKLSSSGSMFYRQQRHGWNGEPFEMLKFRSMVVHHEQNGQVTQAKKGDARITPFGAFIRRTSLDELPQFINVLKGDMSIVGPRPHAVAHNDFYSEQIDGYMLRHKMKPGITGWAQVNGWRGETDTLDKMQKRIEFDLWYIEHWSLWLDIRIIIVTIFKGFAHKNAR